MSKGRRWLAMLVVVALAGAVRGWDCVCDPRECEVLEPSGCPGLGVVVWDPCRKRPAKIQAGEVRMTGVKGTITTIAVFACRSSSSLNMYAMCKGRRWLAMLVVVALAGAVRGECEVLEPSGCPGLGVMVWDPCRCCKVCARTLGEDCGGFRGTCEPGLNCYEGSCSPMT
ncbi:unnamed protein product [Chilo suppressalis]|uniref:IGFBP N-terminal domain-containing protein n=1 Tax=Chilo suppressalis TaxID=168631 RepID=A0ABN8AW81_CHISP|nr:unnamed protein product [Chilo suppressalis]